VRLRLVFEGTGRKRKKQRFAKKKCLKRRTNLKIVGTGKKIIGGRTKKIYGMSQRRTSHTVTWKEERGNGESGKEGKKKKNNFARREEKTNNRRPRPKTPDNGDRRSYAPLKGQVCGRIEWYY